MPSFRERIASGETQLGFCITYPASGIIEKVGRDWDWIWIDAQHGELGYEDALSIVRACDLVQRPAFLRVAGHEFGTIGRALDCAPAGIIVPCVDTPEQARAVVRGAKFPPLGNRSFGGRRPVDIHGRMYAERANEEVVLVCQIESPEAVGNVEAIAAVPGVDALFLGPDDLMMRKGLPMDTVRSKEVLGEEVERVSAACKKHGKIGVMVALSTEMLTLCVSLGFRMICAGSDGQMLTAGSTSQSEAARRIVNGRSA